MKIRHLITEGRLTAWLRPSLDPDYKWELVLNGDVYRRYKTDEHAKENAYLYAYHLIYE